MPERHGAGLWVALGDGDDTFIGGPAAEYVGITLAVGSADENVVNTGAGNETIHLGFSAPLSTFDCGPGDDFFIAPDPDDPRFVNCERYGRS